MRDDLPILYDFEKPRSRDTDETITLLGEPPLRSSPAATTRAYVAESDFPEREMCMQGGLGSGWQPS